MKRILLSAIMVACCFLVCSCGKDNVSNDADNASNEDTAAAQKLDSNPFDLDAIESNGVEVMASYGWGISSPNNESRTIDYDGNMIKLEAQFDNSGASCESGIMVFVDGIAQQYSIEEGGELSYIHPVKLEDVGKYNVSMYFKPEFGIVGKEHELCMAAMYEPSFRAGDNEAYGNYHNLLPIMSWKINYDTEEICTDIASNVAYADISQELRDEYAGERVDGTVMNSLDDIFVVRCSQNNEFKMDEIQVSAPIDIQILGGPTQDYRISFFIDNKLVNIIDGKSYLDINLEEGKVAEFQVSLDSVADVLESDSCMYVAVCPIDENGYGGEALLEKSSDYRLK